MTDIDADFSQSQPDEHLEAIRQEHEPFLTQLEALAVEALVGGDWSEVYAHIATIRVSTKDLTRPGADSSPTTALNERKEQTHHVTTARINAQATGVDGLSQRFGDSTTYS